MNVSYQGPVDGIPGYLDPMDEVVLYPSFGHLSADGQTWLVGVSGVVYRPGPLNLRRRVALRVLRRLLGATAEECESDTFRQRIRCFLVNTQRGRRLAVQLGNHVHWLQKASKRNGHFRGSLRLTPDEAERICGATMEAGDWLPLAVAMPREESRVFTGEVQLIGPTGISVISDIDDTIKWSDVSDRQRLLRNTFLRDFAAVPGMAELYQHWSAQGAVFHYVSSSPWQLYDSLADLFDRAQFPRGSFHLRGIRLRDASILRLFVSRRSTKRRTIRSIVRMFPHRQFVLVGDSGEKDPEIYGAIARQFPRQIQRIVIRRVDRLGDHDDRWARAFRGVAPSRWRLIESAEELLGEDLGASFGGPRGL